MDDRLWLGRIHVVEWLRARDRKTGWELFDDLKPMGIMSKPMADVTFDRIATRAEFIALLRGFENQYRADGRRSVLHIETHGADDGIGNPETDGLTWNELADELTRFNRLTRLNLVVVLAACYGAWGVKMLHPDRRSTAFRGLIGPDQVMDDDEVLSAV